MLDLTQPILAVLEADAERWAVIREEARALGYAPIVSQTPSGLANAMSFFNVAAVLIGTTAEPESHHNLVAALEGWNVIVYLVHDPLQPARTSRYLESKTHVHVLHPHSRFALAAVKTAEPVRQRPSWN